MRCELYLYRYRAQLSSINNVSLTIGGTIRSSRLISKILFYLVIEEIHRSVKRLTERYDATLKKPS